MTSDPAHLTRCLPHTTNRNETQVPPNAGSPIEEAVIHPSLPAGCWDEAEAEPRWWKMCIARAYQSL